MATKQFSDPKIRVPRKIGKDEIIEVRVKIGHNSSTGLKIVDGKYVAAEPPYFLKRMDVFYGAEKACSYDMTSATSPNPLIRFKLKAVREAPLRVVVTNSDGLTKEGETQVRFS
jgi:hypothetical protein